MTTTTDTTTHVPTTLPELREAVLATDGPVRVAGAGTAHDWAGTPAPGGVVVDLRGLRGVVVHNPGDMTVEVNAGEPLRDLQATLAEHGQRVALDPARARDGATVGGLFATADTGPLALTYGSLRDLVIGATVVLPDGTTARTGGHVIKNVAGYDLTKLLHGAHGTFAVVSSLVLRLHPVPASQATVTVPCPRSELTDRAQPLVRSQVEVTALEWQEHDGSGRLLARVEGTERGASARAARLLDDLGDRGVDDARALDADEAEAAWSAHADAVTHRSGGAVLRLGVAPSRLAGLIENLAALHDVARAGGLTAVTAAPATGVATVTVPATAEAVRAAHARVAEAGGTTTLRQRPPGAELPAWGPEPASAPLLRAVAAAFDPQHRLGGGRLSPWLPGSTGPAGAADHTAGTEGGATA